jgi:ubiquinol-cytochrome c reductase iron-sulfur subunit
VLIDFSIDIRPAAVHSAYRFQPGELPIDKVVILRQDNLSILIIKRSPAMIRQLELATGKLQDADSKNSQQPELARNRIRSIHPEYFVSYALGTDLGCPLSEVAGELRETCSPARYDFAGRAMLANNSFHNLVIPDYNFSNDFSTLIIKP